MRFSKQVVKLLPFSTSSTNSETEATIILIAL
jgi:hypothetical protein